MNQIVDEIQPFEGGGLIPQGQTIQRVQTPYATAISVQKPRDLDLVRRAVLKEAKLLGDHGFYGWGAGKDKIQGPSVKMANMLGRLWGNSALLARSIQDLGDSWVFTSAFVDLETGYTMERQFRMSKKFTIYGKHDDERKDDMRFQIGQSKANRNVVLNVIPEWLIDEAMQTALAGGREKLEKMIEEDGIEHVRDGVFKSLAKSGIKEEVVLKKLKVEKRAGVDMKMLLELSSDLKAIRAGEVGAAELFPLEDPKPETTEDLKKAAKKKGGKKKDAAEGSEDVGPADKGISQEIVDLRVSLLKKCQTMGEGAPAVLASCGLKSVLAIKKCDDLKVLEEADMAMMDAQIVIDDAEE